MIEVKSAYDQQLSAEELKQLYRIVQLAYELTEVEVWGENYIRIPFDDYLKLIEKDEILVAYHENTVVGGIHCYPRGESSYSFSLLAADFSKSGLGIGRALIDGVITRAKAAKVNQIEIEILRPKAIELPFKIRLANWYKKMGFKYTHSQNFAEVIPLKAKNLLNPSDFDYYTLDI
ncbi:GNAT family N-acetyltransferase [Crocinitomix catalasitica]|uniref:GNAT family N-acetyltransferase n=1 Tax=Crocinitomix catalasitica TaxID=184607 RepID=UPI000489AE58|nr:GNAT family N-acetyltransferase [Crocinitomix catalasitica]